jgi:hypothetical protein
MRKPTKKQIDKLIEAAYYRQGAGVEIDIFDIAKIFAAGRAALAAGGDLDAAIKVAIETYRKNPATGRTCGMTISVVEP